MIINKLINKIRGKIKTKINVISKKAVNFGTLNQKTPIGSNFGLDRGDKSVIRHYIDSYIKEHRIYIMGAVLEIGDNRYTRKYKNEFITTSDILHIDPQNKDATIIADLSKGENLKSDKYDCIICTQTIQFIYDIHRAINNMYRMLKPGGVLLITASGISQLSRYDMDRWGEYWRLTSLSLEKLLLEAFKKENVQVTSFGNVLSAISLLHGLSSDELKEEDLNHYDKNYEVAICGYAQK
ncbi:MAG: methyltransferase domain-containing protein [Pseudomonadota bacterium]